MREAARSVVEIDLTEITSGGKTIPTLAAGSRSRPSALLAMPADVTLAVKSDGKDPGNGHAGR